MKTIRAITVDSFQKEHSKGVKPPHIMEDSIPDFMSQNDYPDTTITLNTTPTGFSVDVITELKCGGCDKYSEINASFFSDTDVWVSYTSTCDRCDDGVFKLWMYIPQMLLIRGDTRQCLDCKKDHPSSTYCWCFSCGGYSLKPTGGGFSGDIYASGNYYTAVDLEEMGCTLCDSRFMV